MEYLHADLTGQIIGAAQEVHRTLGDGFLESAYENALAEELRIRGIPFKRQVTVPLRYKGILIAKHRLDLVVDDKVIVELKATRDWNKSHSSVVLSYLAATSLRVALLLNFGRPSLEIKRMIR